MTQELFLPSARLMALAEYIRDIQPDTCLLDADICTIGRSTICQIVVTRTLVSRLHARIERAGPRYLLHDVGSANGTFVNGHRISTSYMLTDQDSIGLGSSAGMLRFLDADPTFVPGGRLRYDERLIKFYIEQQPLELPPTQFRLLHHLYQHQAEVCTRESCAQAIWGRDYDPGLDADALDRIVTNLRAQFRQVDPALDLIKTRRGIGYELTL